jgi:hypothetical protein
LTVLAILREEVRRRKFLTGHADFLNDCQNCRYSSGFALINWSIIADLARRSNKILRNSNVL